jgi:hypothetical protein
MNADACSDLARAHFPDDGSMSKCKQASSGNIKTARTGIATLISFQADASTNQKEGSVVMGSSSSHILFLLSS